jgi:hypothetical protein
MEIRDEKGKFIPGHPGLKKRGDVSTIAGDIKSKVADFLNSKADELEGIWEELKPKDKAQMFVDLAPYLVAKQKELKVDFDESERKRVADLFPPLGDDDPEQMAFDEWRREKLKNEGKLKM